MEGGKNCEIETAFNGAFSCTIHFMCFKQRVGFKTYYEVAIIDGQKIPVHRDRFLPSDET